jgi:hypothetical protein
MTFFQSNNATANYYTDSYFNYMSSSSISLFQDIINFKNTYHPNWIFSICNPDNRVICSKNSMYELIIYKNIYCVIPLCIIDMSQLLKEYELIKGFVCKNIIAAHGNNANTLNLINTIGYKFIFYSPYSTLGNMNNNQSTQFTILQTRLQYPLYEQKLKIRLDNIGNLIDEKNKTQPTYTGISSMVVL